METLNLAFIYLFIWMFFIQILLDQLLEDRLHKNGDCW